MSHIALSYSRLSQYELCPLKFKSMYIDKDYPDDSDNYFFKKGQRKHKQLENKVNTLVKKADEFDVYDEDVEQCFGLIYGVVDNYPKVSTELQLSVNKKFSEVDWFSRASMYRSIIDLLAIKDVEALVIDWKTGKFRDYDDSPTGQLSLNSVVLFSVNPEIEIITTSYVFIEHKKILKRKYLRSQYEELRAPFVEAFAKVNSDKKFEPKVNEYCKYCLLAKDKCKFK